MYSLGYDYNLGELDLNPENSAPPFQLEGRSDVQKSQITQKP